MQPKLPTDPTVQLLLERLRSAPWRLIRTAPAPGAWNMAVDWALLEAAAAGEVPTLRFYGWNPPAVSVGRFQQFFGINTDALRRRGWDLVRRPTGGRAVLHHFELTYSIVLPPAVVGSAGVRTGYAALTRPLNGALRKLVRRGAGVSSREASPCEGAGAREPNCFALAAECDTMLDGAKLVGSAQVRHAGALLQHGSILLEADRAAWTDMFGSPGRLTTLSDLVGRAPSQAEVESALLGGFELYGISFKDASLPRLALGQERFDLRTSRLIWNDDFVRDGSIAPRGR